jgi:hypothetical protein
VRIALLGGALLLSGCSTAYQLGGPYSAGYSETRLGADSFQVFAHSGSAERTTQMLELRAAQLTLDSGYQKFVVVDRALTSERPRGPSRMETPTIAKGKMTIRMLNGSEPSVKAVDASAIRARLHPLLIGVAGG